MASVLGLMKEQTLSSAVLCPVMYRAALRKLVCDARRTAGKSTFWDAGGDAMDDDKMWQLMWYWLGAGGVDVILQHMLQRIAAVKGAMLDRQLW